MTKQIAELCLSLPHFKEVFQKLDSEDAKAKWEITWHIIQWENISHKEVKPEQVRILEGFEFQTTALRSSDVLTRTNPGRSKRTEKDHRGVWKWTRDGIDYYQSVMPVARQNGSVSNATEPEVKSGPTNTMVRVSEETYRMLREWANEDRKTLQAVLEDAVREYDRQRFFAAADADYRRLRNDPQAWQEELKEREEWDGTLLDNQDRDEIWHEDGTATILTGRERKSA